MGLEAKTNIIKIGPTQYFLLPEYIKIDDRFPFDLEKDQFVMKLINKKLVIERIEKEVIKNA